MKSKKKKRQDDFQKVKLKVGKTKPKADNATNTNFRTKGIHLTEQLKRDTSGPTTHRQLGINVRIICIQSYSFLEMYIFKSTYLQFTLHFLYLFFPGTAVTTTPLQRQCETQCLVRFERVAVHQPLPVGAASLSSALRSCCCFHRQG